MQAKIKPEKPQKFTDLHICCNSILEIQKMALFFWRYHILHFLYTIVAHLQWQDDQRSTQLKHQNLATQLSHTGTHKTAATTNLPLSWMSSQNGLTCIGMGYTCTYCCRLQAASLLIRPPQAGGPAWVTVEEDGGDDTYWCFSTAGRYTMPVGSPKYCTTHKNI